MTETFPRPTPDELTLAQELNVELAAKGYALEFCAGEMREYDPSSFSARVYTGWIAVKISYVFGAPKTHSVRSSVELLLRDARKGWMPAIRAVFFLRSTGGRVVG